MAELAKVRVFELAYLERNMGAQRLPGLISACEQSFREQVDEVARLALSRPEIKMIMVSGPTSSGKTTFSRRFAEQLSAAGRKTKLISLDDYYYEGALRYDEQGRPDFESVDTLELSLLRDQLTRLAQGAEEMMPSFDFKTRKRSFPETGRLRLEDQDLLMIEGLHALSPEVRGELPRESYLGIFIMPWAVLMGDQRLLENSDLRKLRRISRDVYHRGTSALATLDFWPMIEQAERDFIPRYLQEADYFVNSAMAYEFMIVAASAHYQIKKSLKQLQMGELPPSHNVRPGLFYADLNAAVREARRLAKASENLPQISLDWVPEDSILREFV